MLKKYKENAKENSYWVNMLDEYFWEGTDMNTGYADIVNSITAKDLQEFTKALLEQNNRIEVSMTSEETNNPIQAYASIYYKTESKLAAKRNPAFDRNRFAKFLIYFMVAFWAAYLIFIGVMLSFALKISFPAWNLTIS